MTAIQHNWLSMSISTQFLHQQQGGTSAAAPPPFRFGDPALCGSHPLVTP